MESKFWKPKGFDLGSLFKFRGRGVPSSSTKTPIKVKFDVKNFYRNLGVGGAIALGVVGVLLLLLFFFVIKPALSVVSYTKTLQKDKEALESAFSNQDIDGINAALDTLRQDLIEFRNVRDRNFPWAKGAPVARDYYNDSEYFVNAGVLLTDALKEFVVVVDPFSEAAGFTKKSQVEIVETDSGSGLAEAFATWVKVMPEVADKMDGVIDKVDKVGTELAKVDARRYPESFRGVPVRSNIEAAQQYLTRASEFGPDIKAALTIIPPMLGVGEEKRYAIIMQNDAELRPTGGFWTNYATFRVLNATLNSDFTSKDMYSIDDIIALTDTPYTSPWPKPNPPYRDFLKVEHTFARDANFSPDYVTSIDNWMWYYRKAGQIVPAEAKPIDGVFGMDTRVIEELLRITGPVSVNGVSYSSENVVLELEKIASLGLKEQQGRKKVLGDLMEEMLINMYKSERNLWPKFIETALKLASEKHILAYVFDDPKAQELLEKYNFAGRIVEYDKGDYSFVVTTNLAGDKTNLFITRSADHKIYKEGDKWMHEITVNYEYGEPQAGYESLVRVYRDWVRVYAPEGSKLVSIQGSDATTSADTGEERGKVYFAGHVTVNPKEKKSITFKYEIPSAVVGDKEYRIYLQKQAGTDNDKHTVTINGKTQSTELITDKELTVRW